MDQTNVRVYFDESGNTGENLFDQDQRFFVLGTNCFDDDELNRLTSVFAQDGEELHFVKLKKSDAGRKKIIKFVNHELITKDRVFFALADKLFVVCAKLVDMLVEPLFSNRGIDIYGNGFHLILTNIVCSLYTEPASKEKTGRLLHAFVKMYREKTRDNFKEFYRVVNEWGIINKMEESFVSLIAENRHAVYENLIINTEKYALDVTMALFFSVCLHWHEVSGSKVDVLFDNSKQMRYSEEFITYLKTTPIPSDGDERTFVPIADFQLVDSSSRFGIQISDMIASSVGFMLNNRNSQQQCLVDKIRESKLTSIPHFAMNQVVHEQPYPHRNTHFSSVVNLLDNLVAQMQKDNVNFRK